MSNQQMDSNADDLAMQGKTVPVPTQKQRDEMAQMSDQSDLSQQEVESGNNVLNENEAATTQGHIATPPGLRQDETGDKGFTDDEEVLRADMVQGGD